jgi:hypothetical protein
MSYVRETFTWPGVFGLRKYTVFVDYGRATVLRVNNITLFQPPEEAAPVADAATKPQQNPMANMPTMPMGGGDSEKGARKGMPKGMPKGRMKSPMPKPGAGTPDKGANDKGANDKAAKDAAPKA